MKVTGKKIVWEGKFLRAVMLDYIQNGREDKIRLWEAFERVNCSGVVGIVPFTNDGCILLIRQFRPPINGFVIELPAGLCDPGETPENAARRELIEETGYEAGRMRFLIEGPMSSGASSEILQVFVATGLSHVGINGRDETEDIEVLKVPLENVSAKLSELEKAGDFIDLKVHGLVQMSKNFIDSNK